MVRSRFALVAIVGVLAATAVAAPWMAGRFRELRLARAAPTLDPEMRRHIARDSDRDWYSYCRKAGTEALGAALRDLLPVLHSSTLREFERNRGPAEAAYLRVGAALREIHGTDALERRTRRDMALTNGLDFEQRQWERRLYQLSSDTSLTLEARTHELDRVSLWFLARGDSARALFAAVPAAYCERDLGRDDQYGARLRAAIELARSAREYYLVCQLLGELGLVHWNAEKEDSMRACYDEGIDLARRHGFIDQGARLLRFYATFYAERGQLAVALERHSEAMRLANALGGEAARPRSQIEYTILLASLGCWDLVERSLRSLPPLLRKMSAPGHATSRLGYEFQSELLRAQLAFATGRGGEGVRRMRQLSESVPPFARRVGLADVFDEWSLGLEKSKRTREALEACARGLAHCDSAHVPTHVPQLLLRAARLETSLGRVEVAETLLDSVRALRSPVPERWSGTQFQAEVLRARLQFLRGRKLLARQRIEHLFRKFQSHWRDPDGRVLGNLEPVGAGALRDAIHEIEQFTPEQGYQFEMGWRSLTMRPNPSLPRLAGSSNGFPWNAAPSRKPGAEGTHLVYRFTGDVLVRWVADSKGVVVDTIPLSAERCLFEVRRALEYIQSEPVVPGRFLGPESFACMRGLSELLLPPSLAVAPDRPRRLDITPDGPLSALPFEALPFPPTDGAPPLALTADVAYVRGSGDSRPNYDGGVVIVSNPRVSDELALRYDWTAHLRESDEEARDALKRWPRAALLSGAEATKDSIRRRWPGASIIYLAAHHVRDPDAPFLGFVPLPAPPGAPPDASVLESADIRALDLSACRLAVLASCASGAPYRSAVRPGPSLGDAFLDSGAAAVVRSFWDVGDVETRDFMRVFLANWRADQPDAVSLGKARREVMRSPRGASPRVWAVWSVLTASTR